MTTNDHTSETLVESASDQSASTLKAAIAATSQWLLARQQPGGHWVGELEGDTILESEYILLLAWLGRHRDEAAVSAARYIQDAQLPTGGWNIFPGGNVDISASVKAYFALKLTGHDPQAPYMLSARDAIRRHGGADAVNSFTRFYLALLGQISFDQCPAVPCEMLLLPKWFPINIYNMSSWSRTILVPLAMVSAFKPTVALDSSLGIRELFLREPHEWPPLRCPGKQGGTGLLSWDRFFRVVDRAIKTCERFKLLPLRKRALKIAEHWCIERFAGSQGLGAIFPPMIWSIIALRCLGYRDDSPELSYCFEHLEGLVLTDGDRLRLQPCKSPVWDTAITLRALDAAGLAPRHEAAQQSTVWLLDQEISRPGDWAKTVSAEPSGWCFEYANEFYPDIDDTIMVLMALRTQFGAERHDAREHAWHLDRIKQAATRATAWVLAMQNKDGGWGAFDRDNDREFLCHVPFADHNAMIDPSTPDLTGRSLEAFGLWGRRIGDPAVDRAIAYMRRTQEADGSWFGRWGVNYIYGTWQALVGLVGVGLPTTDPAVARGAQWLLQYQQACGGWGETPESYADVTLRGQGPVTASQTAWALLGLIAAGYADHAAVARGVQFLLETQQADGAWDEPEFTGTGFPQVFYLRYHLYPIYFPLLALAEFARHRGLNVEELAFAGASNSLSSV